MMAGKKICIIQLKEKGEKGVDMIYLLKPSRMLLFTLSNAHHVLNGLIHLYQKSKDSICAKNNKNEADDTIICNGVGRF